MSWKASADKEFEKPKFLKKGTMVTIVFATEPTRTQVDGKFGKREMYIVETKEYGKVYVSPIQLLHIADVAKEDFKSNMTVEL